MKLCLICTLEVRDYVTVHRTVEESLGGKVYATPWEKHICADCAEELKLALAGTINAGYNTTLDQGGQPRAIKRVRVRMTPSSSALGVGS